MSESNKILNAGTKAAVHVVNGGRVKELDSTYPLEFNNDRRIQIKNLTLNGDGVTTDMVVDGSVTPQDFYIESDPTQDTLITSIAFTLSAENYSAANSAPFQEFANLAPLAVGCQLIYQSANLGEIIIADSITTNLELMRMCRFKPAFGTAAQQYLIRNAVPGSNTMSYLGILSFKDYGYELDYTGGLILQAGKNERIIFRINDDITGASTSDILSFDALSYGHTVSI